MSLRRLSPVLLTVLLLTWPGETLSADPSELFRWEVFAGAADAAPTFAAGDTIWVTARLRIAPDHYVYAERTSASVAPVEGVQVGQARATEPHFAYDQFEGREVAKYLDEAAFRIPVMIDRALAGKTLALTVTVQHQGCSKTMCYFPTREERVVELTVLQGGGASTQASTLADYSERARRAGSQLTGQIDIADVLAESGVFLALAIMFLGGVLTSFTPCVYPLIPITVSLFGAARASTLRAFLLSVVFVLGMAATYSILGVSAAATGAVFGSVMSNPVVIGIVALVFLVFAASMFGAFEVRLPSSWQIRLASLGGAGFGGSFAAGLAAGVIAAPCTGPVLGAALTYVATTGDLSFGFAAMLAFALGMGLLFIAIGTFSARIVPKSGPWLEKIKSIFGIAMVVVALYFLKDVVAPLKDAMSGSTTALVISVVLVVLGVLVGAVHARFAAGLDREGSPEPPPSQFERVRKGAGILMVVAGLYGLVGYVLAPPELPEGADLVSLPQPEWLTDEATGVARARSEGKPVLIDAYADWCVACKELDRFTYSDSVVLDRLSDFVAIKLDLTSPTPAVQQLIRKYGIVGLPTVIIIDSRGTELRDRRILGFVPPEELVRKLEGVR